MCKLARPLSLELRQRRRESFSALLFILRSGYSSVSRNRNNLFGGSGLGLGLWLLRVGVIMLKTAGRVPSTALTSDDLDTQMTPVQIMLLVAALFIYGRIFYTCS